MYSVNQVNQFYVVKDIKAIANYSASDPAGTLYGGASVSEAIKTVDGLSQYFKYMGAGGIMATDRIKYKKVKWVSYTDAATMDKPLKTWTIAMNSNVNSGNAVTGEDYILNFAFKSYHGMSDEDQYFKQASARAFGTTASDLLWALASSLAKNFSREVDMPFKIEIKESTNYHEVLPTSKIDDSKTYTEIRLTELIQPWALGRMKLTRPDVHIYASYITLSGVEYTNWCTITEGESGNVIGNGMETADLEWFFHGERGDQYRGKDWPLSISTPASLLVDPSKKYNYLIIHFWDDIDNEGPQKSERDMTFVTASDSGEDLYAIGASIAEAAGVDFVTANGQSTSATKVATPVITIASNKAVITCATPGASIYYAKDDSAVADPTSASTSYTAGTELDVSTDIYIKAIATKSGMETSAVASATNS